MGPPPPPSTPTLYMTPHADKCKEVYSPTLLEVCEGISKGVKTNPGGMNKPYRTNSSLLLQIKDDGNIPKAARETPVLIESIDHVLQELVESESEISSYEFNAEGCEFTIELSPSLNGADESYSMQVVTFANEGGLGVQNYVIETLLVPKGKVDPNPLAPPRKGYREAKEAFDVVTLMIRKAIVRHEFPDFPEGCQDRTFRDVYQLNARVSTHC
jgi:hypothetical protein